ncbi:MAG: YjbQ family protein [Armatimonadetes bacterium]|nr:YjbQ family protein [Armatimonadota bacterium]
MSEIVNFRTRSRDEVVDLTGHVRRAVESSRVREGICLIYCPHTTAGIAINEGCDPDVARDLLTVLDGLVPQQGPYRHAEGNTAAHVKAVLCGASQAVAVADGRLQLGQWQSIQFLEFDGPRERRVLVAVMEAGS